MAKRRRPSSRCSTSARSTARRASRRGTRFEGHAPERLEGRAVMATLAFVDGGMGDGSLTNPVFGYTGTQDTVIYSRLPNSNFVGDTGIAPDQQDADDGGVRGVRQGLMRFDNIFTATNETGKIPFGSQINSAQLVLSAFNDSNAAMQMSLYRMRQNWSESTSTWNVPTIGNTNPVGGVQAAEGEAYDLPPDAILFDASTPTVPVKRSFDVTVSLKHWSSGEANYGWLIETASTNGWDFNTSEAGPTDRPVLMVDYTAPSPSSQGNFQFLDLQPSVGEGDAGTRVISVPVARFGGLAPASVGVTVTAGTASAADFSYTGPTTLFFAEGEGFKTIDIVINGDTALEGLETLAVTLSPTGGSAVSPGRGVATLTIADDDLLINEVLANASGVGEENREYIELIGTPGATIPAGWQIVVFEGEEEERGGKDGTGAAVANEGAGIGRADVVYNLSGLTIGSNGLLVIAATGWLYTPDAGTAVASTPLPTLEDSSQTYSVWYSPSANFVVGEDYDRDRYLIQSSVSGFQAELGMGVGALDAALLPTGAQLIDSVGVVEGGGNDRDRAVGLTNPGVHVHQPSGTTSGVTSDAVSRRLGQKAPNTIGVWFNGDIPIPNPATGPIRYALTPDASVVNPLGAALTPGAPNILRNVSFTLASIEVEEAAGVALVSVTRSGDSADVDVAYTFTDQTASSGGGADYTATPGTLQFRGGAITATISVPINGTDGVAEGFESFLVNLTGVTAPGGGASKYLPVGGSARVTIIDANVSVGTFQQGVAGYLGTADTYLDGDLVDLPFGQGEELVADLQKGDGEPSFEGVASRPQQVLLRFGDLFGSGSGQIPAGAEIFGGFLTLNVLSESDMTATISLHRVLVDWAENFATWQDPQGTAGDLPAAGMRPDGVAAVARPDSVVATPGTAGRVQVPLNVETLQAWANGGVANYGWLIVSDSPDSFRFESSESSLQGAFRPQLTVLYTQPSGAGTLEFALDEDTRGNEGGTASVVVNRVGGSTGSLQFTYAINPVTGSLADLGTATPGSPITFAPGETSKVIQIPTVNDSVVEADETFSLSISVGGSVVDTTTLTIRDNDFDVASGMLRLNEVFVNSPGADNPHEFIELIGTADLGLGGFYVLVLDSDLGPQTGLDDFAVGLGGYRNGASGFTIVTAEDQSTNENRGDVPGDGAPVDNFGFWVPTTTTRITDAALNGEVIANDSASFVLVYSPLADLPTMGFDFDWDNDGVMELPAGAVIVDSIAINDGGQGDMLYGGTNFQAAFVADSISRLAGNTDRYSTLAWFGGDTKGSDDPLVYEDGRTVRLPVEGAALTPGEANVNAASARVRLMSVAPGAGGQSLVLTFDGAISQVLDGDGAFTSATGYGIAVSTTTGVAAANVEPQVNVTGLGTNTLTVTFRGNAVVGGLPPAGTYRLNFVGNSLTGNGRSTDNDRNAATTAASNGSFDFQVVAGGSGLIIVQDTIITVASGSQTDSTVHAGMERLVKQGAGTLVLSAANTHAGGTVVTAGTLIVQNVAALGSGPLEVQAGAKMVLDVGTGTVDITSLVLASGGLLDFGAGKLTAGSGLNRTSILAAINAGKNDGSWNGTTGFTSTVVASTAGRTLGWLNNGGSYTVGFAAPGDSNLDGLVEIQDIAALLSASKYETGLAADWSEGDMNHDGLFDVTDVSEFVNGGLYDTGSYLPASQSAAVEVGTTTTLSPADAAFAAIASESQGVVGTGRKKSVFAVI